MYDSNVLKYMAAGISFYSLGFVGTFKAACLRQDHSTTKGKGDDMLYCKLGIGLSRAAIDTDIGRIKYGSVTIS